MVTPRKTHVKRNGRIKSMRVAKGLTQIQLAEMIGVNPQQISQWENGRVGLKPKNLIKISKALNVPLDELVKEDMPDESKIRDARKKKGIKQEELAKAIGVSRAMLSYYESGSWPVPDNIKPALCSILELEESEI